MVFKNLCVLVLWMKVSLLSIRRVNHNIINNFPESTFKSNERDIAMALKNITYNIIYTYGIQHLNVETFSVFLLHNLTMNKNERFPIN